VSWYQRWKWLDWNQTTGCVLCHLCKIIKQLGLLGFSKNAEATCSESGFCNWKDTCRCFQRHEDSSSHSEAVMKRSSYCAGLNVSTQINTKHSESQMVSRKMLLKLLSSMRYLARQALPLRGNFHLLSLRSDDDSDLQKWISGSQKKAYMSHEIQNECLQLMARHVLCTLLTKIRNVQYYSIVPGASCYAVCSSVTISLFPTSIDLDPIFEKDRDLDRFRFSYRAGQSVGPSVVLNTSGGPGATEYTRYWAAGPLEDTDNWAWWKEGRGEAVASRRPCPSAVIPSDLNRQHAADITNLPQPSLRKERIMCLEK